MLAGTCRSVVNQLLFPSVCFVHYILRVSKETEMFCSRCPPSFSEQCSPNTLSRLTVPTSVSFDLLSDISQPTFVFLSCLLFSFSPRVVFYISVFYWRHGAVCAASLLSSKGIALSLFSVSQASVWYENKAHIYDEPHRDYLLKILIDFICHLL